MSALLVAGGAANANNGGIPGYSGNPGHNGGLICSHCHSGGIAPTVTLTGPVDVDAGDTHLYTFTISGGQQVECGFGASASDGELSVAEAGTQIFNGDATHSAPRPVDGLGECTFLFDWTAPYEVEDVDLYAAGNSVNGDDQTTGDQPASDSLAVTVNQPPPGLFPPAADADGPYSAPHGDPIDFDGTSSDDPDDNIVSWEWDFGDSNTGSGEEPSHTYASPGEYTVTLTVTDATDLTDVDTTTAYVLLPGSFTVERFVRSDLLAAGNFVTAIEGDDRLFVVVKAVEEEPGVFIGKIFVVEADGTVLTTPFLEVPVGSFGAETGMRGMRFAPDYATSGEFYVMYSDTNMDTVLSRFQVTADPNVADPNSEEEILRVPQPEVLHNSSHMRFGPDGKLYVAVADGGEPANGQDTSTLLGSLLRIDPVAGPGYAIPPDNPFVGPGAPLDEIFAYGFRNPYAFDFDPLTGDLYIADVGGARREEVDATTLLEAAGGNFGWVVMEGTYCRGPTEVCESGQLRLPIHEYDHDEGECAIIGGSVYRGVIPELQGRYFFADYCTAKIWSLRWDGEGGVIDVIDHTDEMIPDVGAITTIAAIQRDGHGELVILDRGRELYRVVPVPEPARGWLLLAGTLAVLALSRTRVR